MSKEAHGSHSPVYLPLEIVHYILKLSAYSYSTSHARNICLVNRAAYNHCWPSLYRIIALRNPEQLKKFSEYIYQPQSYSQDSSQDEIQKLRRKQNAIRCIYLNNNKDATRLNEISGDERPDMWMMSVLLAAKNVEILHFEEYWSISYPWDTPQEKPSLAYPLMLLSSFPLAFHTAFTSSPKSSWAKRLLSNRSSLDTEALEDILSFQLKQSKLSSLIGQPREVTLSALAMSSGHLIPSSEAVSPSGNLPHNINAFRNVTHLHLYFAKMDPLLVQTLLQLPQLTHLRLTRPFSENLSEAVTRLFGFNEEERTPSKCIIIEAGVYMDQRTIASLRQLQDLPMEGERRLHFINSTMEERRLSLTSNGAMSSNDSSQTHLESVQTTDSNSTSQVVNWVTNSEARGFMQFKQRACGGQGVWMD